MIDTHAHIRNDNDIKAQGLKAVILSASTLEDSKENLIIAKRHDRFFPAVGVHPQEFVENVDTTINELHRILTENSEIIAVGECGLDYSREFDALKQERLFRGQIALSLFHKKPLIIHSREAVDETIGILSDYKGLKGVIHCYSGGKKRIKKILDLGGEFYFGIDGNLTYEVGLEEVVRIIPKNRLILETDSPELTPTPYRGQKNYPEYVRYVYEKVAEIWGVNFTETEKQIDDNATKLFGLNNQ